MARWNEALDAQTELIGTYFSRAGKGHLKAIAVDQGPRNDAHPVFTVNYKPYLDSTVEALPVAETIYVNEEVIDLLTAAWSSFQPEPILRSDLFTTCGFAYFAKPFFRLENATPLYYDESSIPSAHAENLQAVQWLVNDDHLLVAFYAAVDVPLVGSYLLMEHVCQLPFGGAPSSEQDPIRYLAAFMRFTQQKITTREGVLPERAVRRRAHSWREAAQIVIVSLRRVEHASKSNGEPVAWSHRWPVRGHWRWQWYPSLQANRQIWIALHTKGPEDKPFVAKKRIFEVVR